MADLDLQVPPEYRDSADTILAEVVESMKRNRYAQAATQRGEKRTRGDE